MRSGLLQCRAIRRKVSSIVAMSDDPPRFRLIRRNFGLSTATLRCLSHLAALSRRRDRHRELVEPGQVAPVGGDRHAVRIDVRDAEVVHLLEDVAGNPELGVLAVVKRSAAAAGDDVGDAVPHGAVVDMVVPFEGQADPVLLEQRMENRLQVDDAALESVGSDRVDRLVEEGDDELSLGPRLGEVGFEPAPLRARRSEILLGVDGDEVDVPLLKGVVELVAGEDRLGHPLLVIAMAAHVVVAAGGVIGDLPPHVAGDLVEGLPFIRGVAVVHEVAGLQDQGRLEAHDALDDLAVDVVVVASVAIGGEAEQGSRGRRSAQGGGERRQGGLSRGRLRAGGGQQGEQEDEPGGAAGGVLHRPMLSTCWSGRGPAPRPGVDAQAGPAKVFCYNHHAQTSHVAHEVSIEQQAIQPGSKISTPQQTTQPSPQEMQQAPPTDCCLLSVGGGPGRYTARSCRSPSKVIPKGAIEKLLAMPLRERSPSPRRSPLSIRHRGTARRDFRGTVLSLLRRETVVETFLRITDVDVAAVHDFDPVDFSRGAHEGSGQQLDRPRFG